MRNRSLFVFSVIVNILALCQLGVAIGVYNSASTRDFDFGPPVLIILSIIEGATGITALFYSLTKTK